MIYCQNCGRKLREGTSLCPECGATIKTELNEDETRYLVQRLHKKSNSFRSRIDTGLSFIVIGIALLVTGWLFYFLAMKSQTDPNDSNNKILVVDQSCSEYWVALVGLIGGGILLVLGLFLALFFAYRRRQIRYNVESIRSSHTSNVGRVPSIFVVSAHAIAHFFKELVWRFKRDVLSHKA